MSVNNQLLTQASYISQLNECRLSRAGSELTGLEVGPKLNYFKRSIPAFQTTHNLKAKRVRVNSEAPQGTFKLKNVVNRDKFFKNYFSSAINRDAYLFGHRCSQKNSATKNFKILHDDE